MSPPYPSLPSRVLASAACLWAAALPVAAAGAAGHAGRALSLLVFLVYGIGGMVCHQRPERSFDWGGVPWPVCARCTGIYVGAAVAAMLAPRARTGLPRSPQRARLWLAAGALPAALTLVYEWTAGQMPSNAIRAASGLLLGGAVASILMTFLADEGRRSARRADPREAMR